MKHDEAQLKLVWPKLQRDRVLATMMKIAEEMISEDFEKYNIDEWKNDMDYNHRTGVIHAHRWKIGYISVSEQVQDSGKHEIKFTPCKEAEDAGFRAHLFGNDFRDRTA